MTSVIWTTALGLPVVQPYRKTKKRQMSTRMQTVYINDPHVNHEVSPKKQASAFPPNFIHSLDATHMILTALECHKAGLVFASVHDSYWTHACDIDTMSDIIRETFVSLHTNDILTRLREEFLVRFGDYKVPVFELKAMGASQDALWDDDSSDLAEPVRPELAAQLAGEETELDIKTSSRKSASEGLAAAAEQEQSQEPSKGTAPSAQEDDEADATPQPNEKSATVKARFVSFQDILPPLPPKGTFDVREIRVSRPDVPCVELLLTNLSLPGIPLLLQLIVIRCIEVVQYNR